jgi:hypothetical protein
MPGNYVAFFVICCRFIFFVIFAIVSLQIIAIFAFANVSAL